MYRLPPKSLFQSLTTKVKLEFLGSLQPFSEAANVGVPYKKLFLKISRYSEKYNCGGVSFSLKLQTFKPVTLLKIDSNTDAFL